MVDISEEESLEGWVPVIDGEMTLERVIDLAFDYRGNTTIVKTDGTEVVGYIFNRNNGVPEPFVQLFGEKGDGPHRLLYSEIESIRFTGKDPAAGRSWEAWIKRKDKEKAKNDGQPADRPA